MDNKKLDVLINASNDSRLINLTEHLIYPLLEDSIKQTVERIGHKFREGKTDFLLEAARITVITDLKNELKRLQQKGNHAFLKLEEENNGFSRGTSTEPE